MRRAVVAAVACAAALGCAGARPGAPSAGGPPGAGGEGTSQGAGGAAQAFSPGGGGGGGGGPGAPPAAGAPAMTQRLEQLSAQLAPRGATYRGVAAAGFITEHVNVTTPFDVPAGQCLSIVALASSGVRDLDAHLFAPDGEVLAEDTQPDPHPTVQLCANEPRRVYHVIEAYSGQGAYVVASFASDRRGLEAIARAVGGRPGAATSSSATATDAERRLAELRSGIARRGFLPSAEPVTANFAASGALRFPLAVAPDRCYTLAALAEGSISDADLSVYDPDGEEVARDIRPERDAFVQFCPASAGSLSIEVRARPGSGTVILQAFAADASSLGGANTLWLGERTAWGASATPLPEALAATARGLAAHGFGAGAQVAAASFAPGESREFRLTLEPGRCTAVGAVAGRGLGRLGVLVYDAAGELVARGAQRGPASIAVACPAAREAVLVRVRAEVGSGDASLVAYAGAAPPAWGAGLERVALSEALATQVSTARGPWRAEGAPERVRLGGRAVRSREFDLAAGTCTRFAVSAGRGLPLVALALRDARGQALLEGLGEGTAIVTRCAAAAERVRLEAAVEPASAAEYDGVVARFVRAGDAAGGR